MAEREPRLVVELDEHYSEFVMGEAALADLANAALVQRALAMYALLSEAVESGQQLVLQYLFDGRSEPLLRVDHYLPPSPNDDLAAKPVVSPGQRTHAELLAWPPPEGQ